MDGKDTSSTQVIEKLIEMGFENFTVKEAVEAMGPSFDAALEYILNGEGPSSSSRCSMRNKEALPKRTLSSLCPSSETRQSSILDHFQSIGKPKRRRVDVLPNVLSGSNVLPSHSDEHKHISGTGCDLKSELEPFPVDCTRELDIRSDWEKKVITLLQKHFGYSHLKNFQKEALTAWLAHQDCLVLAATGSGRIHLFYVSVSLVVLLVAAK